MEADGNYQVNSVNDINNTYLGFQAGEDSLYTLTFTHLNPGMMYSTVYLVDSLRGNTVDITATGSTYTFSVLPTDTIEKRFKIVATPLVITGVQKTVTAAYPVTVFCSGNTVFVDNKSDQAGILQIYDIAGRRVQDYPFTAGEVTTLRTGLSPGVYVTAAVTKTGKTTTRLVIH
jgi:hypothetical protein